MTDQVNEAVARDLLPEGWTLDCQGKQDFDADLVSLSCRYYPGNYSRDGSHSVTASIILGDGQQTISTCDFSASSEAGVKALAEEWARQQIASLIAALMRQALPAHSSPRGVVDDRSPSYDALLIIVQSVCGALDRAGIEECDDPGEAIDVMRERYEARIQAAALPAATTQGDTP